MNRRDFLTTSTFSLAGLSLFSNSINKPVHQDQTTILFQGDSITDAGRNRANYYANNLRGMGNGYVFLTASELLAYHPDKNIKIYNRGISGNKVFQLASRWEEDCLQLQPDILSILIGVNDFWHTLTNGYGGTVESYKTDFKKLLDRSLDQNPSLKLIIGEPFCVKGGTAISEKWSKFADYQEVARNIAVDYNAAFIQCQSIFDKALTSASVDHWCPDGVHPSMAGCQLMSDAWVNAINKILK